MGVSDRTLQFYRERLSKSLPKICYHNATRKTIEEALNSIPGNKNGLGTRNASFRTLKTFFRWYSLTFNTPNPMQGMRAPILGKPMMPALTNEQVQLLLNKSPNKLCRAFISLGVESGGRLTELANIKLRDIDWKHRAIRILGKGRKEGYMPFGPCADRYLREWLSEHRPGGNDNIWGISKAGICSMLKRLGYRTGLPCNPHVFRRTFACLLRQAGVDCLVIKDLGRWESVEMVIRYTRSITFQNCMKWYKPPLG